jgi:hypothetical protein
MKFRLVLAVLVSLSLVVTPALAEQAQTTPAPTKIAGLPSATVGDVAQNATIGHTASLPTQRVGVSNAVKNTAKVGLVIGLVIMVVKGLTTKDSAPLPIKPNPTGGGGGCTAPSFPSPFGATCLPMRPYQTM